MSDLLPFVISGLALGATYALSGVGIVVLVRTTGVINLAYGAFGAVAALVTWSLRKDFTDATAIMAGILAATAISTFYGTVISPRVRRDPLVQATAALGAALVVLGLLNYFYSDDTRILNLPTDGWRFFLGDAAVTGTRLAALVLALVLTTAVAMLLRRTRLGTQMRALATDRELAGLLGVRTRAVEAVAWAASGAVAGITGILLGALDKLTAASLTLTIVPALAAALVARFRSLAITVVAGFVIGLLQGLGKDVESISRYTGVTPFVVAVAMILFLQRRSAAARRGTIVELRSAAAAVTGDSTGTGGTRVLPEGAWPPIGRALGAGALAFAVLAVLAPVVLDAYWTRVVTTAVIFAVPVAAVALLYGRLGLVSLGQVAMLGVGGWVALRAGFATEAPFLVVMLAAGAVTCLIGVLYGLPAVRLGGINLAIVTLMLGGAVEIVLGVTGFPDGSGGGFLGKAGGVVGRQLPRPGFAASNDGYFRLCVIVVAVLFALFVLHQRRRPGRAWAAIRESEAGALASGVPVVRYKLWAFALGSFATGIAGALLAFNSGSLDPVTFGAVQSIQLFAVTLFAGAFSLVGASIAGALLYVVPALLQSWGVDGNIIVAIFGAALMHALIAVPQGIAGQFRDLGERIRPALTRAAPGRPAGAEPDEDKSGVGPPVPPIPAAPAAPDTDVRPVSTSAPAEPTPSGVQGGERGA